MGTHPIFESDFDCLTEMNLNEQLTEIVLERVDSSAKELSNKASKYLRERKLDEEFIPQVTLDSLKDQTRNKLKILNQSFRYSNSYDKLIKLKERRNCQVHLSTEWKCRNRRSCTAT